MLSHVLDPPNLLFTGALLLMLMIAAIEMAGMMFGASLSSLIDNAIPDFDIDADFDADIGTDIDGPDGGADGAGDGILGAVLGWLYIGKVPILILFVIFLFCFGVIGLMVQSLSQSVFGVFLPSPIAILPAFALTLPALRVSAGLFVRYFPKEETYAVTRDSFIGRVASVTLGTASEGRPAEAKVKGPYGRTHYIRVLPDNAGEAFSQGSEVLLVRREGVTFYVISAAVSPGLSSNTAL